MNYQKRIEKVVEYIGKHLDEPLSLEKLCEVACCSKYHFHRLFTANCGVSLSNYIRWLRLKRAAHQLSIYKGETILNIALDAGFESHEAFSRAFKQICGQSPSEFKSQPDWAFWEKPPYAITFQGNKCMNVTIENKPQKRLAVMEHHGDPLKMVETINKLIAWAKAQPIDLSPRPGRSFGFGYQDPRTTPPEEFRFDLAIHVPDDYRLDDTVLEKILPAGRYAVTTHKGSRDNIGDTIYPLYRDWIHRLDEEHEELADFPCVFHYINFEHEVAETELLTEIWVLLK